MNTLADIRKYVALNCPGQRLFWVRLQDPNAGKYNGRLMLIDVHSGVLNPSPNPRWQLVQFKPVNSPA